MNIEVTLAGHAERLIVRNLMELYQHDFSELDGTDLDEHGQYGYPDLDCFWNHAGHAAHVIKVDGKWAGFALTNQEVYLPGVPMPSSSFLSCENIVVRRGPACRAGNHTPVAGALGNACHRGKRGGTQVLAKARHRQLAGQISHGAVR